MTSGPPISAFSFLKTQRFHAAVPLGLAPCGAKVSAWWLKPQEPWIIYPGGRILYGSGTPYDRIL